MLQKLAAWVLGSFLFLTLIVLCPQQPIHGQFPNGIVSNTQVQQTSGPVEHEIDALIQQLGESQFIVRERARKRLAQLGLHTWSQLQHALATSTDLEIRRNCELLVRAMTDVEVKSEVIQAGDVDFCAVASHVWQVPKKGAETNLSLGLRFVNRGKKPQQFYLISRVSVDVTTANGEVVKSDGGRDRIPKDAVHCSPIIEPGGVYTFNFIDAKLCWNKDGDDLRLIYVDRGSCEHRYFRGLAPGKYHVRLGHKNNWSKSPELDSGFWIGDIITNMVEVEVK